MLRLIVNVKVKVSVKVKVLALVEGSDWRLVFASHSQL
jgi:hypothetical protein